MSIRFLHAVKQLVEASVVVIDHQDVPVAVQPRMRSAFEQGLLGNGIRAFVGFVRIFELDGDLGIDVDGQRQRNIHVDAGEAGLEDGGAEHRLGAVRVRPTGLVTPS